MRHCLVVLALLGLLAGGCTKRDEPVRAGGKPASHWVNALKDHDPKVRKEAAVKLGNLGPANPEVVPALTGALKDPDAGVRQEAIVALSRCGAAASDAIPALTELQSRDPSPEVRDYAGKALKKLQRKK
jgi:HEAT repeat protein